MLSKNLNPKWYKLNKKLRWSVFLETPEDDIKKKTLLVYLKLTLLTCMHRTQVAWALSSYSLACAVQKLQGSYSADLIRSEFTSNGKWTENCDCWKINPKDDITKVILCRSSAATCGNTPFMVSRKQEEEEYSRDCGWPRRPWPNAGRKRQQKRPKNQFF